MNWAIFLGFIERNENAVAIKIVIKVMKKKMKFASTYKGEACSAISFKTTEVWSFHNFQHNSPVEAFVHR